MRKNTETKKSAYILIPRKMIDCIEVADQNNATPQATLFQTFN